MGGMLGDRKFYRAEILGFKSPLVEEVEIGSYRPLHTAWVPWIGGWQPAGYHHDRDVVTQMIRYHIVYQLAKEEKRKDLGYDNELIRDTDKRLIEIESWPGFYGNIRQSALEKGEDAKRRRFDPNDLYQTY